MTEAIVPELKIIPRNGGYARGHEGLEQILRAAFRILVDQGHEAFTLRRIAAEAGMSQGNLGYYFKSKQELFQALIEAMAAGYGEAVEQVLIGTDLTPEQRFRRIISLILQDITTKKTTRIFTQLWSLANFDPFVQEQLDSVYQSERGILAALIAELNPKLSAKQRETLALFICATLEGTTIFAGHGKPHGAAMPEIEALAVESFLHLVWTTRVY